MPNAPIPATAEGMPRAAPTAELIEDLMRDLEGQFHDLLNMSRINCDMFENFFNTPDSEKDGRLGFTMGRKSRDAMLFAVNDIEKRASALKGAYLAALDGETK